MKPTLLVLAAGMGSRYGGLKQMDDRIRSLTSSRDSLEKFAREHFHFAEPGDDVFIIEDKK